ncbi:MAG: phosphatidate cytidylyltransferase [Bacteroidales bacterium]|jgi:phosphatidate cytidylyltransferase|nr:phosphatidate cytidylyltransferase [Bacteroidales bacterium]
MKNLITRTATGILFVAIMTGAFFANRIVLLILFFVLCMVGTWEYIRVLKKNEHDLSPTFTLLLSGMFFLLVGMFSIYSECGQITETISIILLGSWGLTLMVLPVAEMFRDKNKPVENIALTLLPLFWIALPFSLSCAWAGAWGKNNLLLALLFLLWLNDTLAYGAGSLWGKHRLFERVSPKKSWEGFVIGLVLTVAAAPWIGKLPCFENTGFSTTWQWWGFAATVVITGTFGDLVESMFKRSYNVKDSGRLLPGHGGVLDRFDSFLFAAPAGFIYHFLIIVS